MDINEKTESKKMDFEKEIFVLTIALNALRLDLRTYKEKLYFQGYVITALTIVLLSEQIVKLFSYWS